MDYLNSNTEREYRQRGQHLTPYERGIIESLHRQGKSYRAIAKVVGCSPSTVYYEIKRGTPARQNPEEKRGRQPIYSARRGQKIYEANRKKCKRPYIIKDPALKSFIDWLVDGVTNRNRSLDQCLGYAKVNNCFPNQKLPCLKTLYNAMWRESPFLSRFQLPFLLKRVHKKRFTRLNRRKYGSSIDERPAHVKECKEFGHWEIDTMVARRNRGAALCTIVEKSTRYTISIRIPGKTVEGIKLAMEELIETYGSKFSTVFKTITADNGTEFAALSEYRKYGIGIYFAHPYSSWERAQNERMNRDLRKYFPKKMSLDNISNEYVQQCLIQHNSMPRKVLNYKTPEELFDDILDDIYSL